jgi:hypothetical protein
MTQRGEYGQRDAWQGERHDRVRFEDESGRVPSTYSTDRSFATTRFGDTSSYDRPVSRYDGVTQGHAYGAELAGRTAGRDSYGYAGARDRDAYSYR